MRQAAPQPRIRVAAVIIEEGRLLLVHHEKNGQRYWMLPGGGVDHGETLAQALQRELREELCIETEIGPLLLVHDGIPNDRHRHIVNLYFRAHIREGRPCVGEDERIIETTWHPLETLDSLAFRPAFPGGLKEAIHAGTARYIGNLWVD